jgi:hypothetical protein
VPGIGDTGQSAAKTISANSPSVDLNHLASLTMDSGESNRKKAVLMGSILRRIGDASQTSSKLF